VRRFAAQGVDIKYFHREDRVGYKAGALEAGLKRARGEFVGHLRRRFHPDRGFLTSLIPHFRDPQVGMVQARWGHINQDYSLLTKIQAILLDGHFILEHGGRNRGGRFFNFNGTAGIWRPYRDRRRRRLAARHADRGPRPQLSRAVEGLAVRLRPGRDRAG
jgi:cellulose synthase/poly-beta-1,6-N-acetylglucosamine synthase-like glycosyltransferase